jgi:hypothetical protein
MSQALQLRGRLGGSPVVRQGADAHAVPRGSSRSTRQYEYRKTLPLDLACQFVSVRAAGKAAQLYRPPMARRRGFRNRGLRRCCGGRRRGFKRRGWCRIATSRTGLGSRSGASRRANASRRTGTGCRTGTCCRASTALRALSGSARCSRWLWGGNRRGSCRLANRRLRRGQVHGDVAHRFRRAHRELGADGSRRGAR